MLFAACGSADRIWYSIFLLTINWLFSRLTLADTEPNALREELCVRPVTIEIKRWWRDLAMQSSQGLMGVKAFAVGKPVAPSAARRATHSIPQRLFLPDQNARFCLTKNAHVSTFLGISNWKQNNYWLGEYTIRFLHWWSTTAGKEQFLSETDPPLGRDKVRTILWSWIQVRLLERDHACLYWQRQQNGPLKSSQNSCM